MDLQKEREAFLDIYKYYPSAIKFTFDVENECFILSKKNPLDREVEVMSQMNQQWLAWLRRAKLEYEKLSSTGSTGAKGMSKNPIKQRFNEEVMALLKRLEQSRNNGTGMTLSVEQVGVAHELISVACDIVVNDIAGEEVNDENNNP